jgi:hypothetical protein
MKSIRNLIVEEAAIIRNGEWPTIPSVNIVVGDSLITTREFFLALLFIIIPQGQCPCRYLHRRSIFGLAF